MSSAIELINSRAEKGWGMLFKADVCGVPADFCIHGNTLGHCFPSKPGTTFVSIFEQNLRVILHAAQLLASTGRLDPRLQLGGTEILKEHIHEVAVAQQGIQADAASPRRLT